METKEVRTIETWNALKKRRVFTEEFKRKLVAEAEVKEEGNSVARVAYLNHIPATQLHKWKQKYGTQEVQS